MWDLPGPGLEPMSPALAAESTTAPPGKSLTKDLRGPLCIFLELLFYATPSSPVFYPANSRCLSRAPVFVSSAPRDHCGLFGLHLPARSGQQVQTKNQVNKGSRFPPLFPSFMDHNPVLPIIQYLKTVVSYILYSFLLVDSKRASLIPVRLLQLAGEVQSLNVFIKEK